MPPFHLKKSLQNEVTNISSNSRIVLGHGHFGLLDWQNHRAPRPNVRALRPSLFQNVGHQDLTNER